jgi:hypothetical protein
MFRRSRSEGILELELGLPGFRGEGDASETEHLLSSHGDVIIERSRGVYGSQPAFSAAVSNSSGCRADPGES